MSIFRRLLSSFKKIFHNQSRSGKKRFKRAQKDSSRSKKPKKRIKSAKTVSRRKLPSKTKLSKRGKIKKSKAPASSSRKKSIKLPKEALVGEITHYFSKIEVCVIKIKKEKIQIGDQLHLKGSSTDFYQKIESLQIESVNVKVARKGQLVGLKIDKVVRVGDQVFKAKK